MTLTAAGEELRAAIAGPFDAIGTAVDGLNRFRTDLIRETRSLGL